VSWNYRIFRHTYNYALHEAYYDDKRKDGDVVKSWTKDPICGEFESIDDLIK